ncbi:MAG: selenocysteine-specific translation elongation factor [Planctomycetota bacterium]
MKKGRPPGFVRPTENPDVIMMVCTAGHVDHGKTRLVKLLTGCNTARLKEEQERGLTIELGYAPCLLGGEVAVGIVDVPGHERFVRNMVAGVSGIDMAILVIAADDGIMPQTIEHFQIMRLVGVRHGMVALTKTDLVDAARVAQVTAEIRESLAGTFLDGARICPVSAETFDGFFEFYEALVAEVRQLEKRRSDGVFRMPIINSFTSEGFGAVVTGIPVDGTIAIGDPVELVPGHQVGKVRGLQRFLRDATTGGFGQCLAVNVPELGKLRPVRGQVLCRPGHLEAWPAFHLQLEVVPGVDAPLRHAEPIVFHTGTAEGRGKLYLLEAKSLGEGERGLATIVLDAPIAAAVHDRFILRRPSPARTVAGGEIVGVTTDTRRRRRGDVLAALHLFQATFAGTPAAGPARRAREVEHFLRSRRPAGASPAEVGRGTLLAEPAVAAALEALTGTGTVLNLARDCVIHAENLAARLAEARERVQAAAGGAKHLRLSVADLRQGLDWPAPLWTRIQAALEAEGLVTRHGSELVLERAVEELGAREQTLRERILAVYEETGLASPHPDEIPARLGAPAAEIERLLELLCAQGEMFRLAKNVALSRSWLKKAQDTAVAAIRARGVLDSGDFKNDLGSTRKYALAVLDFLDARHVTVRRGNIRTLSANYERNLV